MPSDIFFTEDKRQWNVEWYKTHHNGLFICHAANSLGVQSYSHDTLFFLHAESKLHTCILHEMQYFNTNGIGT